MKPEVYLGMKPAKQREYLLSIVIDETDKSHIIKRVVCEYYNIAIMDITGKSRKGTVTIPRFVAMFYINQSTNLKLQEIADLFNNRNHSSVIYALTVVEDYKETDKFFNKKFIEIGRLVDAALKKFNQSKMEELPPLTPRQQLIEFVIEKHKDQKRKYTGEPYYNHVKAVAEMADEKCKLGYEIGLCHDLIEDTECTDKELREALTRFGYAPLDSIFITQRVNELTDVYISANFTHLNRANRKALEARRLSKISYEAQTVKYCDLIHNTASIIKHDKKFAEVYLKEKATILHRMTEGNPAMFAKCKRVVKSATKKIVL